MSSADAVKALAERLVALLERLNVPYYLMGGITVPVWGIPRATYDLDVTVHLDRPTSDTLLVALEDEGFVLDEAFRRGYRDQLAGMEKVSMAWWTDQGRSIVVDVFWVTTPYQHAAFERRIRVALNGWQGWVLSAADLLIHKLMAARPKDLADLQNILLVQGVPDADYVAHWAQVLGVRDRLEARPKSTRAGFEPRIVRGKAGERGVLEHSAASRTQPRAIRGRRPPRGSARNEPNRYFSAAPLDQAIAQAGLDGPTR